MSTQIREIVDLLNKPPFSKNFSLCAPRARLRSLHARLHSPHGRGLA